MICYELAQLWFASRDEREQGGTTVSKTHGLMILFPVADSMEINILGIIGPILKCEWLLHDWQVALYSSVSITTQI